MGEASSTDHTDHADNADPGWLLRRVPDQRLAFLLVGGFNTAFGFTVFVGFDRLYAALAPGWGEVLHNTVTLGCSHIVSVIVAFALYRTLVFRVSGQVWRDLMRFESVYLVSLGANWILLNLLTVVLRMPTVLAQAFVVGVIALVSFFGHKHFSFRRPQAGRPPGPDDGEDPA